METKSRAILLVGASSDCPDIEYATGFRAVDPVVLLKRGADRYLIVSQLEFGRAQRVCKGVTVFCPETLELSPARRRRLSDWILGLLKRTRTKRVIVPPVFPLGIARRLERNGVLLTTAKKELFPERAVKSGEEIRKIRESQQAAVIAMRAAISMIAGSTIDGNGFLKLRGKALTSADVRRTIAKVLFEHDCFSRDTIVAGGLQAADPHETGEGPLHAHEAIVIDIFPQHIGHGYWGDLTRTVVKGRPSPSLKRMYKAVKAAHAAALEHVRAGVSGATVHGSAAKELDRRGFGTTMLDGRGVGFIHGVGHGVGLSIHEAPSVTKSGGRLKRGNVITIEPGLYYPTTGGIRIEDTILVTSDGWRYLVPCEKKFEV